MPFPWPALTERHRLKLRGRTPVLSFHYLKHAQVPSRCLCVPLTLHEIRCQSALDCQQSPGLSASGWMEAQGRFRPMLIQSAGEPGDSGWPSLVTQTNILPKEHPRAASTNCSEATPSSASTAPALPSGVPENKEQDAPLLHLSPEQIRNLQHSRSRLALVPCTVLRRDRFLDPSPPRPLHSHPICIWPWKWTTLQMWLAWPNRGTFISTLLGIMFLLM